MVDISTLTLNICTTPRKVTRRLDATTKWGFVKVRREHQGFRSSVVGVGGDEVRGAADCVDSPEARKGVIDGGNL